MVNVGSSAIPLDLNTGLDWRVLGFSLAASAHHRARLRRAARPFAARACPVAEALKQEGRGSVTDGGRTRTA